MRSSRTITLFSAYAESARWSYSYLVSVVAHAAGIGILSYGIIYAPVTSDLVRNQHYTVRHLVLHTPGAKDQASSKSAKPIQYPGPHQSNQEAPAGGSTVPHEAAMRQTTDAEPGPQTIIQPDIAHPVHLIEETPVPSLVIWTPKKQVVKNVVSPLPEPATASDVRPSLQAPTEEVNLKDLSVAASDSPSRLQFLSPSTTSPLVVHGPQKAQLPPVTALQTQATPTPAAVMSLSDLRMKDGPVALPPVNETAMKKQEGPVRQGDAATLSKSGQGNPDSMAGGSGAGTGVAQSTVAKNATAAGVANPDRPAYLVLPQRSATEAKTYSAPASADATAETSPQTTHFVLPKNGQFGAVVVGATMKEEYPEVSILWGGRLAYTVYLHVGLEKSWILQFSIPRTENVESGGSTPRLEAPWPYNIVRPNLVPGAINADSLMVHGFVNEAGRFESLAVAFPPDFPQQQYVLSALSQWQFRPAAEDGHPKKVEIVLIIPEVDD
jgi:hypothetical protein